MSKTAALPLLWCLLFCGCQSSETPGTGTAAAGDRPVIALVMKSLANEFFATMAEGAESHAAEHADEYQLIVNGIPNETDLSGQVALIEQMMAREVNAIVVAPADSQALIPVLLRAQQAGIAVINIDNRLDADLLAEQQAVIPFIGPDNRAGARQVGEFLAKSLSTGAEVGILEGIETSFNGQQRKLGFEEAMQAAGVSIVASQSAQWEMSLANQTTTAMLNAHPEIQAVLACNDSMALGALAAAKAAGRVDLKIVGFDNIEAVQDAVRDGRILATADQHGDQLAVYGIQFALEAIRSGSVGLIDRETAVDLVTAETLPGP